jgi:hypothetical protein
LWQAIAIPFRQGGFGMDADRIRQLKPMLTRYLKEFDDW